MTVSERKISSHHERWSVAVMSIRWGSWCHESNFKVFFSTVVSFLLCDAATKAGNMQ